MEVSKAPPRIGSTGGTSTPRATRAPKAAPASKLPAREEAVNGVFQLATFGLVFAGQHADAGAVMKHGPNVAHEAAKLADTNDKIAKGIDYLSEAGPYAGLVTALLPLIMQIMANHKVVKSDALTGAGVVPPEALAAEVKAKQAEVALHALQVQREAEEQLRNAQAQFRADQQAAQTAEAARQNGDSRPPQAQHDQGSWAFQRADSDPGQVG